MPQRVKLGQSAPLIHIQAHMQTWLHQSIVKTLIMPKNQKAVNEGADNGRVKEMVKSKLGSDWY